MTTSALSRTDSRVDLGIALLRVLLGILFIAHGGQKIFSFGLGTVTSGFSQMGIPMASITAPLVAIVELVGGIALVLGLFTKIAAILLAIDMIGAILLVHLRNGFFLPNGYEFALTLLVASVAMLLTGPGAYSLDHVLAARRRAP